MRKGMIAFATAVLLAFCAPAAALAKTQSDTVDPKGKMVALTFDDGPNANTRSILKVLEKYNARATFFVQGQSVKRYRAAIRKMDELGCEIGSHTWNHPNLTTLSASAMRSQIRRTDDAVTRITGEKPSLLRPPYGSANATVKRIARSEGKALILWSVDTLDWKTRNAAATLRAVKKGAADGAVILMHDIHAPTARAAEKLVPWLINHGYQLVTVSELAYYRSVDLQDGGTYRRITGKKRSAEEIPKPVAASIAANGIKEP